MDKKVDFNSEEFKEEFKKTAIFSQKVCDKFEFVLNPLEEITQTVREGLTRQKLIYGKRYCPCFMVIGDTPEEIKKADNRLCPCKPALEVEIPRDGICYCGIYCTPEHAKEIAKENNLEISQD